MPCCVIWCHVMQYTIDGYKHAAMHTYIQSIESSMAQTPSAVCLYNNEISDVLSYVADFHPIIIHMHVDSCQEHFMLCIVIWCLIMQCRIAWYFSYIHTYIHRIESSMPQPLPCAASVSVVLTLLTHFTAITCHVHLRSPDAVLISCSGISL